MNVLAANSRLSLASTQPAQINAGEVTAAHKNSVTSESAATVSIDVSIAGNSSQATTVAPPTYAKPVNNLANNTVIDYSEQNTDNPQSVADNAIKNENSTAQESKQSHGREQPARNADNQESFTEQELALIDKLKSRDSEVLTHERAHSAVGGQYAGAPSYSYKTGPDGVKYAVSGEVSIDTSKVAGDPQATLRKAQQIKAAALAPAQPSAQDQRVAAKADKMAAQSRSEIMQESSGGNETNTTVSNARYEATVPDHFTGTERLAKGEQQQLLNNRINQINMFYQNSSISKPSSSLQIQI